MELIVFMELHNFSLGLSVKVTKNPILLNCFQCVHKGSPVCFPLQEKGMFPNNQISLC